VNDSYTPTVLENLTTLERSVVHAARHGALAEPDIVMEMEELVATKKNLICGCGQS
jgi:hypothetical protein